MSRGSDDLFSRWSKRKRAVAAEDAHDTTPPAADEVPLGADEAAHSEDALAEPELLEKLGLPDPDTLTSGDDFSAFMQKHVPEALRRRALRRLWSSNPVLANLDGLVDHGEDYTDAAMVPEKLVTAYRVGKGFLRNALAATDPEIEAEDAGPVTVSVDHDTSETASCEDSTELTETGQTQSPDIHIPDNGPQEDSDLPAPPQPRRMTFQNR